MSHDSPETFPISRRTLLVAGSAAFLASCAGPSPARRAEAKKRDPNALPGFNEIWQLQSSEVAQGTGETLSMPNAPTSGWYKVTLPSTVLAALVANGEYPDLFVGDNLKNVPKSRFFHAPATTKPAAPKNGAATKPAPAPFHPISWWYRKEFHSPRENGGKQTWLYFKGINYRANIFLNGRKIADAKTVVGTYRDVELNITPHLATDGGPNTLAVEVFPPDTRNDLAITFVDWAPSVPDANMGLWQDVELRTSGPVIIRYPYVQTDLDTTTLKSAALTIHANVTNATDASIATTVTARFEGATLNEQVTLAPNETKTVTFTPDVHPELKLTNPRIWWPWQLGKPEMYPLQLTATANDALSDSTALNFGIRKVTSRLIPPAEGDDKQGLLFTINGTDLLLLGGGYAPDLLQRRSFPERPNYQEDHVRYTKDMNLNTIRLEGKLEDDDFYDLCDEYGVLVMPGWCCCSPWERWKVWKQEQHDVAMASLRYQMRRIRQHPSIVAWLNGSDNPPTPAIEREYLAIEKELNCPVPTISSATAKKADSGPSGVKMEGPYKWVPPIYWLTDKKKGGAHGFNTEVGPGPVPPPLESLEKMLPADHRWPIDAVWDYHGGGGSFAKITDFTDALNARFGQPRSLADFAWKSQAQGYETIRAMYEGFRRNKFNSGGGATGEIQWMLNNAWPSMIWHLYDYYLRPGGAYFGTKIGCELLHALYSYDNNAIVVANDTLKPADGLTVSADLYDIHSQKRNSQTKTLNAPANVSTTAFILEVPKEISTTYFVRLTLKDSGGETVSTNSYFLSTKPDVLEFDKEDKDDWNITRCSSYADFTQLETLPQVKLTLTKPSFRHYGEDDEARVRVQNESDSIALLVRLKLAKSDGEEVLPIRWEDNYFMLLPGESRDIGARYLVQDAGGKTLNVSVDCYNNGRA